MFAGAFMVQRDPYETFYTGKTLPAARFRGLSNCLGGHNQTSFKSGGHRTAQPRVLCRSHSLQNRRCPQLVPLRRWTLQTRNDSGGGLGQRAPGNGVYSGPAKHWLQTHRRVAQSFVCSGGGEHHAAHQSDRERVAAMARRQRAGHERGGPSALASELFEDLVSAGLRQRDKPI